MTHLCGKSLGFSKIPHVALNSQEFLNSSPLPKGIKLSDRIQAKFGGKLLRRLSPTADLRVVGKIMFEKHPWSKAEFVGAIIRQSSTNTLGLHRGLTV